ncbi:FAD/NAD(P)-binding protein [Streptomyces chattanoogensis]|uniref:Oxidoreductase n=1 Tax=Streptomyces chattanoogensis TaxID=66876 RepID=A0A0N0H1A7_9ACTN|nr:FAD/NAD(P)-binding protein [Streptomyces chattanoogensis]KPC64332.1 oxidoreductase [Streptomyces chattanoogensis]
MTALHADMAPVPYRVVRRRDETADTAEIVLEPVSSALPPCRPGQFAMVYAFGVGDIPLSLSGIDGHRLTHTVRAVGAVSRALYGLRPGATVGVRGPFGTGWDLDTATGRDLVIVAGGLGLAPLRPLVAAALGAPPSFGRLTVLIGTRTPGDLLCTRDIDAWRANGADVHITVDRPDTDWTGDVGVVTTLLDRAEFVPGNAAAFLCGPEVMIRATAREFAHRGLAPDRIRVSLERTMHCGTGHCGHCQLGPLLLCRDGPVVAWTRAEPLLPVREL